MITPLKIIFLAAALISGATGLAVAQAQQDSSGMMNSATMGSGMMGSGAKGPGMMGGGSMMGAPNGGMGADMGGGMMSMMGMMHEPDAMIDHVEGRIAFLKVELKITDQQLPAWNSFAEALRANARTMNEAMLGMMQPAAATVMARLKEQEKLASDRLEAIRKTKGALAPLYAMLTDEQKKTADGLLFGSMGPHGMM